MALFFFNLSNLPPSHIHGAGSPKMVNVGGYTADGDAGPSPSLLWKDCHHNGLISPGRTDGFYLCEVGYKVLTRS